MAALYVVPVDVRQGVFWVKEGTHSLSVEMQWSRCGCATWKKTRTCAHLQVVERYCRRHSLTFVTAVCPGCDLMPALMKVCTVCAGRGRLPEAEARALRLAKWPIPSEEATRKLLAQFGERTERDVPLTRRRFRAADDEAQAA